MKRTYYTTTLVTDDDREVEVGRCSIEIFDRRRDLSPATAKRRATLATRECGLFSNQVKRLDLHVEVAYGLDGRACGSLICFTLNEGRN